MILVLNGDCVVGGRCAADVLWVWICSTCGSTRGYGCMVARVVSSCFQRSSGVSATRSWVILRKGAAEQETQGSWCGSLSVPGKRHVDVKQALEQGKNLWQMCM